MANYSSVAEQKDIKGIIPALNDEKIGKYWANYSYICMTVLF